jgi:uncharacterized protein YbjT (DUF2867 family)
MQTTEVLVTGGTGVLGSRVTDCLHTRGYSVRVLSRRGSSGTVRGDLATGEGVEEAVAGVQTIVHCASSPRKTHLVDVEGTERLLRAAEGSGVSHFLYISIVGIDRNPFPYYRAKLEAERLIEHSAIQWTILRATQFHPFVLRIVQLVDRGPLVVIPKGFLLQPIDAGEVADRLIELALGQPGGRAADIGGPEVRTFTNLAHAYLEASGRNKSVVEIALPGKVARAFRQGAQTCPNQKYGEVTWEDFLRAMKSPN